MSVSLRTSCAAAVATLAAALCLPLSASAHPAGDHAPSASWTDAKAPHASWTDAKAPRASWTDRRAGSR